MKADFALCVHWNVILPSQALHTREASSPRPQEPNRGTTSASRLRELEEYVAEARRHPMLELRTRNVTTSD